MSAKRLQHFVACNASLRSNKLPFKCPTKQFHLQISRKTINNYMQSLVSGVPNKVQTAVDIYQCTLYIAVSLHSLETAAAAAAEAEEVTDMSN